MPHQHGTRIMLIFPSRVKKRECVRVFVCETLGGCLRLCVLRVARMHTSLALCTYNVYAYTRHAYKYI